MADQLIGSYLTKLSHSVVLLLAASACGSVAQIPDVPLPDADERADRETFLEEQSLLFPPMDFRGEEPVLSWGVDIGIQEEAKEEESLAPAPEPRPPKAAKPLDPLTKQALSIAPAVMALRAWDDSGAVLATSVGTFISPSGTIITDASLLHPVIRARIAYITAQGGFGTVHEIDGVWLSQETAGAVLLRARRNDEKYPDGFPFLKLSKLNTPEGSYRVIASDPKRGLLLTDVEVVADASIVGAGWLKISGNDSPATVGSPIISPSGEIAGMAGLLMPSADWVNFGLPASTLRKQLPSGGSTSPTQSVAAIAEEARSKGSSRADSRIASSPEFLRAVRELYSSRPASAARKLLPLVRRHPSSAECWGLLGVAARELGDVLEAKVCAERAAALRPDKAGLWLELAAAQIRGGGGFDSLLATAEKAVEANPLDPAATLLFAEALLARREFPAAEKQVRRYLRIEPRSPHGLYLLAASHIGLGNHQAAADAVTRSLQINRRYVPSLYLRGLIAAELGDLKNARKAFERVTKLERGHPKAWMNLAHTYRQLGQDGRAREAAKQHSLALAVKPGR